MRSFPVSAPLAPCSCCPATNRTQAGVWAGEAELSTTRAAWQGAPSWAAFVSQVWVGLRRPLSRGAWGSGELESSVG